MSGDVDVDALKTAYARCRQEFMAVEHWLQANDEALSDKDSKRLDKAVVVTKAGFKMIKKILHSHGVKTAGLKHDR